jgi:hypothetical protein
MAPPGPRARTHRDQHGDRVTPEAVAVHLHDRGDAAPSPGTSGRRPACEPHLLLEADPAAAGRETSCRSASPPPPRSTPGSGPSRAQPALVPGSRPASPYTAATACSAARSRSGRPTPRARPARQAWCHWQAAFELTRNWRATSGGRPLAGRPLRRTTRRPRAAPPRGADGLSPSARPHPQSAYQRRTAQMTVSRPYNPMPLPGSAQGHAESPGSGARPCARPCSRLAHSAAGLPRCAKQEAT